MSVTLRGTKVVVEIAAPKEGHDPENQVKESYHFLRVNVRGGLGAHIVGTLGLAY